ncbi:MAG: NUDIX hydrolase [Acholeplasmatales bacterium]|nr:NUDIX hydrolase [Acholeplasmatales bacterium]
MELLKLEKKYEGKFLSYYVATYKNKEGGIKLYELISRDKNLTIEKFHHGMPQGVGMVALSLDGERILMQKEFRMATNEWVYNFPAGLIDEGETAEIAAKRELREETGLELKEIIKTLPPSYASQGTSDEMMTIVICKVDGEIKESNHIDEEIEASWFTKSEAKKLLDDGALFSVRTQMFVYMWVNEK